MKKHLTLFSIIGSLCLMSFKHSSKVAVVIAIFAPAISDAQFIQDYRPPYKAAFYPGNWSLNDLYIIRDEADGLQSEFRFNTTIKVARLASPHNDGSPSNIVWLGADTLLKLSPVGTLSLASTQLTGVSITGAGATTVTGTGLNLTITTPTVQGNITPTITSAGSATVTSSGNTFTINAPAQINYTAGTGISISGGVITNTATASSTSITSTSTLITVSGSAPNYSITARRQQTYSGTTSASGTYTVTFGTAYSTTPNIVPGIIGDFPSYTAVVSNKSTTGFTVKVYTLSSILSLGLVPQYSAVPSVPVDVIVTQN